MKYGSFVILMVDTQEGGWDIGEKSIEPNKNWNSTKKLLFSLWKLTV